jgi:hypothetical protein
MNRDCCLEYIGIELLSDYDILKIHTPSRTEGGPNNGDVRLRQQGIKTSTSESVAERTNSAVPTQEASVLP